MGHPADRLRRFQAGGALHEAALYVERRADAELHAALSLGGLAAVIAPRQMGKSSLRRRAERRQRELGVRCAGVDLAVIGARGVTEASWLYAVARFIADRAGIDVDLPHAFTARGFTRFLGEDLCAGAPGRVAVFFDELDVALGLPFPPEDFFAALLAAASPRLAVCLFGVTEPDRWTTERVQVIRPGPFTIEEAAAFLPGLEAAGKDPGALLSAVFARTGGHPYLTQRLCELLVQEGCEDKGSTEDRVERAVNDGLLDDPAIAALRPRYFE